MNETWKIISDWIKKNYFTMFGIMFVLVIVGSYWGNVESRVVDTAEECNEFWIGQVALYCPEALDEGVEARFPTLEELQQNNEIEGYVPISSVLNAST